MGLFKVNPAVGMLPMVFTLMICLLHSSRLFYWDHLNSVRTLDVVTLAKEALSHLLSAVEDGGPSDGGRQVVSKDTKGHEQRREKIKLRTCINLHPRLTSSNQ